MQLISTCFYDNACFQERPRYLEKNKVYVVYGGEFE